MSDVVEATPPSGSLAEAAHRIEGLLSVKTGTEKAPVTPPEPEQREAAADPKLVPAAPEKDGSESAESAEQQNADDEPAQPQTPKTWKVPVSGEEVEVTEDELVKGYSRTADYTRKTQALADERKKWEEGEVAAARTVRAQQLAALEEIKTAVTTIRPKEPDWNTLRNQLTPDQFSNELLAWKQHVDTVKQIDDEKARISAEQSADAEKGFSAYVQNERQRLELELPEMKDPEKAPKLKTAMNEFAKARGFTDDDLNQVTDHRVVLLLHDAYQHHLTKKTATETKAKIENKITNVLETAAPGGRQDTTSSKAKQLAADKQRLRESGRVEDAGRVFAQLIKD